MGMNMGMQQQTPMPGMQQQTPMPGGMQQQTPMPGGMQQQTLPQISQPQPAPAVSATTHADAMKNVIDSLSIVGGSGGSGSTGPSAGLSTPAPTSVVQPAS